MLGIIKSRGEKKYTMLEPNTELQNRYRIVRVLGSGGMEQVYLAHDTRLTDKPCAVKELTPGESTMAFKKRDKTRLYKSTLSPYNTIHW